MFDLALSCGRPARVRGPALREQRADGIDRGEPHEAVDDPAGRVRGAELLAEDPGDEVELGERDQAPVEPADDEQGSGELR